MCIPAVHICEAFFLKWFQADDEINCCFASYAFYRWTYA